MNNIEFIKAKLNHLFAKFPYLTIRYQYAAKDQVHIIEVLPLSEFENNSKYQAEEAELTYEFDNTFFPESLLFVSENSLTKITEPGFEHKPNKVSASFPTNSEKSLLIKVVNSKISKPKQRQIQIRN
jgi:hypothetical protein